MFVTSRVTLECPAVRIVLSRSQPAPDSPPASRLPPGPAAGLAKGHVPDDGRSVWKCSTHSSQSVGALSTRGFIRCGAALPNLRHTRVTTVEAFLFYHISRTSTSRSEKKMGNLSMSEILERCCVVFVSFIASSCPTVATQLDLKLARSCVPSFRKLGKLDLHSNRPVPSTHDDSLLLLRVY